MTQIEFENRTMVEVSAKEFEAINEVYMNCDLDKDEFCKSWVKMNKSRVAKAAAERKAAEQKQADKEAAINLYREIEKGQLLQDADTAFTSKQIKVCEKLGIEFIAKNNWGMVYFKSVLDVCNELLNIARA